MRYAIIAAALSLVFVPALADDAPVAHQGDMLRDANNNRLGSVDAVNKDGSVGIIYNSHYVTVPSDSLSLVNGKLTTKLTKAQISSL